MSRNEARLMRVDSFILAVRRCASTVTSNAPSPPSCKYGRIGTSCVDAATRKGASASIVTQPRRDRRREVLGEEWAERLVFPALDVVRRPVVDETDARNVPLRLRNRNRRAEVVPRPKDRAEFHLVVEFVASVRTCLPQAGRSGESRQYRSPRATTSGRDRRSARACSWAVAGCPAGTFCRRWWHGGSMRKSPCNRPRWWGEASCSRLAGKDLASALPASSALAELPAQIVSLCV